jgi:hypothetical protein
MGLGRAFRVIKSVTLLVVLVSAGADAEATRIRFRAQMTVDEFTSTGLAKLTTGELATLEAWVDSHLTAPSAPVSSAAPRSLATLGASDPLVSFNTSSHKYHCPSCRLALQCTKNCIDVRKSEAQRRGGTPCGGCGGTCN